MSDGGAALLHRLPCAPCYRRVDLHHRRSGHRSRRAGAVLRRRPDVIRPLAYHRAWRSIMRRTSVIVAVVTVINVAVFIVILRLSSSPALYVVSLAVVTAAALVGL